MPDLSNKQEGSFNAIDLLVKINSFILIFVTFLSTATPFDPSNYYLDFSTETSNIRNQVVYLFLFFSSSIIIANRFNKTLSFIKSEKYASLFILLCLVSALWSEYSFLSIKRSFQLFVIFLVVTQALLNIEPKVLLNQLKIVVSLYLFINLISTRLSHFAIDPLFGTWRGIEQQKNLLAQSTVYCLLSSIVFFTFDRTKISKYYNTVLVLVSLFLIYKAKSSTSIIAVGIIAFMVAIFKIETYFGNLKIGRSILGMILVFIISFSFIFLIFSSEIFASIPELFGKDMTLSMRVPIWEYLWTEVEKHLLLGYGFATYWIMGDPRIEMFARHFNGFRTIQAHNGYLEIVLQLGVVGFTVFLFPIFAYIYRMLKLNSNVAIIIIVSILTLNLTESILFKVGWGVTTFYFLASYTAISIYYFNLRQVDHDEEIQ